MPTRDRRKRTSRIRGCNHKTSHFTFRGDTAVARHCVGCGAPLTLGHANEPEIDVRAAEIAQDLDQLGQVVVLVMPCPSGFTGPLTSRVERDGWNAHSVGETPYDDEFAGFLARDWLVYPSGEDWSAELVARIAPTHPAIAARLKREQAERDESCPVDTRTVSNLVHGIVAAGGSLPYSGTSEDGSCAVASASPEVEPPRTAADYEASRAADPDLRDEDDEPDVAVADDLAGAARALNAEITGQPRSWPPHTGCDPEAVRLEPAPSDEAEQLDRIDQGVPGPVEHVRLVDIAEHRGEL